MMVPFVWISHSLLVLDAFWLSLGAFQDLCQRKCSNRLILAGFCTGILFAWSDGHLGSSFLAFLCLNFVGMLAYTTGALHAGDLKYCSVCFFLFSPFTSASFWFLVFFGVLLVGFWCLYFERTPASLLAQLREESWRLVLAISHQNPFTQEETEMPSSKNLPLTVPILLAALLVRGIV